MTDKETLKIVDGLLKRCRDYVSIDVILIRCNDLKQKEECIMKEVKITTKTKKGEEALRKHWDESMKLGRVHKFTFKKMGYVQNVVCEKPFTILMEIRNRYFQAVINSKKFLAEIMEAMELNGATKKDYKLEVTE